MKPENKKQNVKTKNEKKPKKKGSNKLIIGIVAVLLLAVIAYAALSTGSTDSKKPVTLKEVRAMIDAKYSGPGREPTNTAPVVDGYKPIVSPKAAGKFPDFVYTSSLTLKAYTYATEHPEVLEQIPCYCNCGVHGSTLSGGQPHKFLRDCFINDKGQYDDHASYCDTCVAEALMAEQYLPDGIPASGNVTGSTTVPPSVDLSALSLADNFKNIGDALNLTPSGAYTAYFTNLKMLIGTDMEPDFVTSMSEPDSFYGKKLIGMYSADFSANPASWMELHDLGYDSTKDTTLKAHSEPGMENIIYTRPLVYGHSQNVENVLKLFKDPSSMPTSYETYKPLLDAVDYKNAGFAQVKAQSNNFSDMNYMSLTPVNGEVVLVKAYHITNNKSIPTELNSYDPIIRGNVLIIKMTGDLNTVEANSDRIDEMARA